MTVSKLSARAAAAAGQRVGSRHYVAKFKCHVCGKPYAKPTLFMTHLKSHKAGDGISIGKQKIAPLPLASASDVQRAFDAAVKKDETER